MKRISKISQYLKESLHGNDQYKKRTIICIRVIYMVGPKHHSFIIAIGATILKIIFGTHYRKFATVCRLLSLVIIVGKFR